MEDDVHDIFKLSGMNHAVISEEAGKLQERKESESSWMEDLDKEKRGFKSRADGVIKQCSYVMTREQGMLSMFSLQGDAKEAKHKYQRDLNEYVKVLQQKRKPLIERYNNSSKRYTGKQVDELIEGDLAELLFTIQTLNDHIEYLDFISQMMVNLSYSIKYIKDFEDYSRK